MTFKELLNSVQFEDVAPHIVRMYPDMENSIGWYKIHFDMLRLMNHVYHEDANGRSSESNPSLLEDGRVVTDEDKVDDKVCNITMKDWEDGSGLHLNAYPMEGDLWEHSLTKELIIAPEVKASNEELAACCLWHTSFYGFIEKHVDDRFRVEELNLNMHDRWDDSSYFKARAMWNFGIIRKYGGSIPTIRELAKPKKQNLLQQAKESVWHGDRPINRQKRMASLRKEFMSHYYERMAAIRDFIFHTIPAQNNTGNYLSVEQLCGLFHSDFFCSEEIMSFAPNGESAAKYLYDLLSSYDMIPKMDGIVVRLVTGASHEVFTEDEKRLCNLLAEGREYCDLILDSAPSLGNQVAISYAAYNSRNPLVK